MHLLWIFHKVLLFLRMNFIHNHQNINNILLTLNSIIMVFEANHTYVVDSDITLTGSTTLPSYVTLIFQGGKSFPARLSP